MMEESLVEVSKVARKKVITDTSPTKLSKSYAAVVAASAPLTESPPVAVTRKSPPQSMKSISVRSEKSVECGKKVKGTDDEKLSVTSDAKEDKKCKTSDKQEHNSVKEPTKDEDEEEAWSYYSDMSSNALKKCYKELLVCQDDHLYHLSSVDESVTDSVTGERVRRFKDPNTKVFDVIEVPVAFDNGDELPDGYIDKHARGLVENKDDERYHRRTKKTDENETTMNTKLVPKNTTHTRSYSKVGIATRSQSSRNNRYSIDDNHINSNTRTQNNPYAKTYISPYAKAASAEKVTTLTNSSTAKETTHKTTRSQDSGVRNKNNIVRNPYKKKSDHTNINVTKTSVLKNPSKKKSTTASKLDTMKSNLESKDNDWLDTNKGKRKRITNPYIKKKEHIKVGCTVSGRFGEYLPLQKGQSRRRRETIIGRVMRCVGKGKWEVMYLDGKSEHKASNALTLEPDVHFDEVFRTHHNLKERLSCAQYRKFILDPYMEDPDFDLNDWKPSKPRAIIDNDDDDSIDYKKLIEEQIKQDKDVQQKGNVSLPWWEGIKDYYNQASLSQPGSDYEDDELYDEDEDNNNIDGECKEDDEDDDDSSICTYDSMPGLVRRKKGDDSDDDNSDSEPEILPCNQEKK